MHIVYIRPQITYAAEAWAFLSKRNMRRLQVAQNIALRIIGGYDIDTRVEQLHSDIDILTFHTYMKQQAHKFYDNLT